MRRSHHHPLHCFVDETGEHLAGVLRPGNAGANTAADHILVLDAALAQLPPEFRDRDRDEPAAILAPSDSAGATHAFAAALRTQKTASRWATPSTNASGRPRWRSRGGPGSAPSTGGVSPVRRSVVSLGCFLKN